MSETGATAAGAEFTGSRGDLFGRLLRGDLLMLPTLGLYRFWVTTGKRRFYWTHTRIAGDELEYTGNPVQLLVGFLLALGLFVPLYAVFFVLSTQGGAVVVVGYAIVGAALWFFMGYAFYRGRDFRLSRTLWRGVRLGQDGNAWAYALKRFGWSLLVVVTLGLTYPLMVASLWRYRYRHTLFGDRRFDIEASWKTVAGPYYRAYAVVAVFAVLVGWMALAGARTPAAIVGIIGGLVLLPLVFFYWRSREASRLYSAVRIGEARLMVRIRARSLLMQFALYALALLGGFLVVGVVVGGLGGVLVLNGYLTISPGTHSAISIAQSGLAGFLLIVASYFGSAATFALMGEVFLDCGFWMLVARGATLEQVETLEDVIATDEDRSLVGEGLSDALNVGSF